MPGTRRRHYGEIREYALRGIVFLEPGGVFAALKHGAPDLPAVVPAGTAVIAAASAWGSYGSVVVLRRDEEEDDALLDDVYLLACSADGRWQAPDSSAGSGMPEWVLDRPSGPLPDWRGSELVSLGAQLAHVAGHWVAELTVMASRAVATVEVRYGGDTIAVPLTEVQDSNDAGTSDAGRACDLRQMCARNQDG
jgi:hypothetical protein